jgi:hypothetical protein
MGREIRTWGAALCVLLASASCAKNDGTTSTQEGSKPAISPTAPPAATAAPVAAVTDAGAADSATATVTPPVPLLGREFLAEGKEIFRVAACGSDDPLPPKLDPAMVEEHCTDLRAKYNQYKTNWIDVATPFIAALRPKDLPKTIVYPFGGGDLMSALATFPDLTEITTISLEAAGDARKIDTLPPKQLKAELKKNRVNLGKLFDKAHSRTDNLDIESKSTLPGGIVFMMVALALHGYEPTSLRYFKLTPDGAVSYLEAADIAKLEADAAKKPKKEEATLAIFKHVELQFRKKGDPSAPTKILRHMAFNLDNDHMKQDPSMLKYLEARGTGGRITAMAKAASHLLWSDDFSTIRDYLATHMEWMISDSTGLPPKAATKAGFVQDTYGQFTWPIAFGTADNKNGEDMKRLFKTNPQHDLSFRYGYPDRDSHAHMIVTHKPNAVAQAPVPAPATSK